MFFKLSNILVIGLLMAIIMSQTTLGQKRTNSNPRFVSIAELNSHRLIGLLGYALGETVVVEGVIADENYRHRKADVGELLLRIRSVNGKKLKDEIIFNFHLFTGANITIPHSGAEFKYSGYETGEFSGMPDKAFIYVSRMPTTGFHFATYFVVLRDEILIKWQKIRNG